MIISNVLELIWDGGLRWCIAGFKYKYNLIHNHVHVNTQQHIQ